LNWRLIAIPASIVPFLIMFIFTPVSLNDVFAVGLIPFIFSAGSMIVKIMLQAYRFKYFIEKFIGPNVAPTGKIISARLAGEFVTQTTPSYVGGELVRIAWLTRNGVSAGKAAWVTTMEIIADVFVGTMLGFIAGAVAIYNGGIFIGIIVIIVAIPTLAFWLLLVIFSAKRNLRLPSFSLKILQKFVAKEKAERLINTTNNAITDVCKMSRENFNSIKAVRTFAVGIGITFIAFLFQGISFMVLADAVGSNIGLFDSLMATSASIILATLPITIGGSGLAELGIWAYISNLSSIPHFTDVIKDSQLNVIIAWRIASYHIPLVIMWLALMKITVRSKVSVINPNISIYSSNHSVKPNLADSNASKNNNNNNKPLTRLVRIIKGSSRRKIDVNKK
jgi:glycosyltransferase 2 family protein